MAAVSAKITHFKFFKRHICKFHQKVIDFKHINECHLLQAGMKDEVTSYNKLLVQGNIYDLPAVLVMAIRATVGTIERAG